MKLRSLLQSHLAATSHNIMALSFSSKRIWPNFTGGHDLTNQTSHINYNSLVTQGGGLVLLWRSDFDLTVVNSSLNYIDAVINAGKENPWRFTGFYGYPETHKHSESWNVLRALNHFFPLRWLCVGDFNEIVKPHEKLGGRARPENRMRDFRDVLDECSFVDLGYVGQKYTWNKRLAGGITVWERLDRAVANTQWLSLFPGSSVTHLDSAFSYHKPLIIHPDGIPIKKLRPWRFEQVWLKEDACHTTVESAWTPSLFSLSPMSVVESNLMTCQTSKESFCNITRAVRDKKKEIEEAEKQAIRGACAAQMHYLRGELRDLLSREEKLWQQRSKQHWLKDGDQNTSFFHGKASQRFRRNSVKRLRNSNGDWCEGDD